ncbi:hypothetical protein CAI21_13655 [Alkalilimnicola ehrlichii]|uniref:DNA-binding response regulator n=1 Tax=Alkalilimnicola ehrlichii TaxID=351052 RepID=A0A3E0WP72_9GAMM|nr:response regulator transcription factor [Alkalilimnicola ehrlichii]RFA27961.1 hypothetical protein CAI21_13655 [Alkalilimnicola ehrlichii]RFA34608.1 hypothetical protein CAL65_14680 [Alkalilimnicola ehrlichii]
MGGEQKEHAVVVVDGDCRRQRTYRCMISTHPGLNLLWVAGSYDEALQLLEENSSCVMVIDLALADGDALELIRVVERRRSDMRVVAVAGQFDARKALAAFAAGARGYVLRDSELVNVAEAAVQVAQGYSPLDPLVAGYVLAELRRLGSKAESKERLDAPLTRREREVLCLLVKGLAYGEVANTLGLSINTVCSHIKNIYRKLGVRSRSEAVYEVMAAGVRDVYI